MGFTSRAGLIAIIAACQLVLMGGPDPVGHRRHRSLEPVGVYLPGDKDYPGGAPFDPFKLADDAEEFEKQKVMEIKHGRLADDRVSRGARFRRWRRARDRWKTSRVCWASNDVMINVILLLIGSRAHF